ncbi:hypothetical protein ES703_124139 [subsurface metagenome]
MLVFDFLHHSNKVEFLSDHNTDSLGLVEPYLMVHFQHPVPGETHHRNGTNPVEAKEKVKELHGISHL